MAASAWLPWKSKRATVPVKEVYNANSNTTITSQNNTQTTRSSVEGGTAVEGSRGRETLQHGDRHSTSHQPTTTALPDKIRIGTDCSGMEAPIQAMRNLTLDYAHVFSCDSDQHVRATIDANFPHGSMYPGIAVCNNHETPETDVYVVGFPCQPFSLAGAGKRLSG